MAVNGPELRTFLRAWAMCVSVSSKGSIFKVNPRHGAEHSCAQLIYVKNAKALEFFGPRPSLPPPSLVAVTEYQSGRWSA